MPEEAAEIEENKSQIEKQETWLVEEAADALDRANW